MAFLVRNLPRIGNYTSQFLGRSAFPKRCFSNSAQNPLIGSVPSQPVLTGEQGHDIFLKNMKFVPEQGSMLSYADMQKLKMLEKSPEAVSSLAELMTTIKDQTAEMQQLNRNIRELVSVITHCHL